MRAQTPGGVTTGLNLWLDASDGAAVSSNNLTAWTDKTAINTFTVSALPPTVTANAINFHSTVDFNNSTATDVYPGEQSLVGNTAINYTDAYAVFKVNDGNGGVIIGGTIPGSSYGKAVFAEFNSGINSGTGDPVTYSNFPFTDFENYHVFGMDTNIAGNLTGRLDGLDQSVTNSTGFSSINLVPTIGTTNNNGNLEGWNHLKGQIAEVIIYNQSTAGQRINIESYLALKYGINKAGSYVNSSNTIIWNSIANAAYHNDIFGIGQDDISGLNQNIANSMNTGSGDGMGQSGKGNIVISNPSALTNNSFLVIGHDINDFSFVTNNLPASSPQGFMRMNRTWKTQTTGSTGAINLQFDTAAISIPSALNDLKLLIDSDGDGDLTTGIITTVSSASVSGNNIVFENVTFPAGATFPFAKMITSPTGITTGLKLWLDAKSGVTLSTGTQVLQWADKSPSLNNADQGSSANQPILTTNVFNFNPALKLDGVSQYMTLNTIGFSTGIAPRSAFFVASENGNTSAEWIFSYGSNSTNAAWNIGKITGNAELYVSGYSNDAFSSSAFWPIPANSNTPKLGGVIYNGNFASFYSADNSMGTTTKNWNTGVGNGYVGAFISGGEKWKGNIAEILYYSTELSSIDRAIIQSYLAIKYGIHNTGNYFSSANIVIWDATLNAAYH
ncbi:MAG: hypothetical protein ABI892_06855, partial [Flavobacterium sp.]